jgi:hypothetical protein
MRVAKVLAVLAAILLVGAVALATLGPPDMTFGEGLAALDHVRLQAVEHYFRTHLSVWVWEHPLAALFARPLWLMPAALGLVCAGAAATAATMPNATTTRRRRS